MENPNDEDWRGWKFDLECHCIRCQPIHDYIDEQINIKLGHLDPRKGKNMNVETNNYTTENAVGELAITDVKHYYIDDEGNRVEIPFDVDAGDSETASEETTVYIAADAADHVVTVH